jgi:hypothetical protein
MRMRHARRSMVRETGAAASASACSTRAVTAGGGKRRVAGGGYWGGRPYSRLADVGACSPGRASRYRHPRKRGEGAGAMGVHRRGSKMSA